MPKSELFPLIAEHIDKEIHSHYRLYPCNLVAAGMETSDEEVAKFNAYLDAQLGKVSLANPDMPFLRERMITMYANPARNQQKAKGN